MGVNWEEQFSKEHPLNLKIKDTDLFLHGTSSKKYWVIQTTGFLLRGVAERNVGVSRTGICFEKYVARAHPRQGQYCGVSVADRIDHTIKMCCKVACESDDSSEAVVLQIEGRELKKLGCPIYADWNKPYWKVRDAGGVPIDVNYDAPYLSIMIIDCDIPLKYLKVVNRVPFERKTKRMPD